MSNEVYVRLKALRKAHLLKQFEMGKILHVDQATVSRIEANHTLIDEQQYNYLVAEFGKEEVAKYMGEPPWVNAVTSTPPQRRAAVQKHLLKNDASKQFSLEEMAALAHIIAEQRQKIESLEKEILRLKGE